MDTPTEKSPKKIESSKNINLLGLDKNITHLISGYLTDKDLVNLCCVSKNLHSIFYPSLEKRLMFVFLQYVVEGCLDKVEEILNRNKKLVFLPGDIMDLSGRVFPRITAFQYATWALDKEMWELILRYLPEEEAYKQLMAFEQKRPDITQIHGTRLNFAPLLEAYQKYINSYNAWYAADQWGPLESCWCKEVGGAQTRMPAWYVYVFCEEGEDKAWPKNNVKKSFTRDAKALNWWFGNKKYNDGKLGTKWGATRMTGRLAVGGTCWGAWDGCADRSTTSHFMEDRTAELSRLAERLSEVCGGKKLVSPIK